MTKSSIGWGSLGTCIFHSHAPLLFFVQLSCPFLNLTTSYIANRWIGEWKIVGEVLRQVIWNQGNNLYLWPWRLIETSLVKIPLQHGLTQNNQTLLQQPYISAFFPICLLSYYIIIMALHAWWLLYHPHCLFQTPPCNLR